MRKTRKILNIGEIYNDNIEIIDIIDSKYVMIKCLKCDRMKKMYIYNVEKNKSCGCCIGMNKSTTQIDHRVAQLIKDDFKENKHIPCTYLAKKYNISINIIYNIKYRKSWNHIN